MFPSPFDRQRPDLEEHDAVTWPPPRREARPGEGNPHIDPPSKHKASNATIVGVWSICAAFFAAIGTGYITHTVIGDKLAIAKYEADQRQREADARSLAETITNLRLDIKELQVRLGVVNEPKPLQPAEPKKPQGRP